MVKVMEFQGSSASHCKYSRTLLSSAHSLSVETEDSIVPPRYVRVGRHLTRRVQGFSMINKNQAEIHYEAWGQGRYMKGST